MRAAMATAVALATLAGCAGGDDGLSHDEYIRRANAICGEEQARVDRIRRPGVLELFGDYLDETLPIVRRQRDRVAELDPPENDEEHADAMVDGWDDVIWVLEEMRESAKGASDVGIVMGLRRAAAAERAADSAARELGVTRCAGFNPFTR